MSNDYTDTNSNISPEWEERLVDFAFGTMDPEASAEFERGLADCQARLAMAQQYRATIAMLGRAVPAAEPPDGHKARFLQKLAATSHATDDVSSPLALPSLHRLEVVKDASHTTVEREAGQASAQEERIVDLMEARRRKQGSLFVPALAMAAAAIILLMGAWLWSLNSSLSEQEGKIQAAEQRLATEQAQRLAAERRLDDFASTLNVPEGYKAFSILPQAPYTSTATAIVLFNPDTKDASLLADRLEPLAQGKVYELWLMPPDEGAQPQQAGTFTPAAGGLARHTTVAPTNVGSYAGFAVTIEDAPGSSTPKGPIVLAGSFR